MTNADQGVVYSWNLHLGFNQDPAVPQLSTITGGGVSTVQTGLSLAPMLQSADGTFFGTADDPQGLILVAFDSFGNQKWSVAGYGPVLAIQGGGVIAQSSSAITAFDQNGNAIGQLGSAPSMSWTGTSYGFLNGLAEVASQPGAAVDNTSFWPQAGGNPSGNGTAAVQYYGLLQSTDESVLPSNSLSSASASASICPICALQSPNCVTLPGTGSNFVIIVGDPGRDLHNLKDLLNLAAQQKANDLNAQGHRVVACRASTIQDFDNDLLNNGFIDGGVIYYGHGGPFLSHSQLTGEPIYLTILAVGQGSEANTNISTGNVSLLSNVRTQLCSNATNPACNIIGPSAAILINGCNAGTDILDFITHTQTSIAQHIALQTSRRVYAYQVGVYFSHQGKDHDAHFNGIDIVNGKPVPRQVSWGLPMYAVPEGVPGSKPDPIPFPRNQPNPPPLHPPLP